MMHELLWIILLIAFAVLEGLTVGLVSIWFCVGALAGLLLAAFNFSIEVQIIVFALVSLGAMAILRPLTKRYWLKGPREETNAHRIIGNEALVIERINNLEGHGQIRVGGMEWTARSEGDVIIEAGESVFVQRIEGVRAIVCKKENKGEL